MIFDRLDEKYIEDAVRLAKKQYDIEQKYIDALYEKDYTDTLTGLIYDIFKRKCGVIAVDKGNVLGYLSFIGGINGQFGNVKGSFSPLYANAYGEEDRGRLVSLLFQHASKEMIKEEIFSYAICVYGHDDEIIKSLTMNGFGIRCSDGIRNVDKPLKVKVNKDYSYEEIHYNEAACLLSLKNGLVRHMKNSPTYLYDKEFTINEFIERCINRNSRFFIARDKLDIIGYLEITNSGETFITEEEDYLHICGAYLKESYRGKNIYQSLLSFVIETLKKDGIKRIGVDCETINPTALRFWGKYFDNYTYSFVRRVDERIFRF
ncbi:Acetyltransferase (GNAT) family protein [Clostridium cavendishii DSM 21758]|uniref:Acetyltransferase (GNAT) family protein n=1 Tax=Clostridium cavendishii DSM 21758 TaxID=1121302 RepID=A0A1M6GIU2_9CLOT|nr:GNAT family N-acetyltransferase [Clostridium cavendishii]SHJ09885.1 Acetyltransferase (GNAT) family protein [Clostridium cavendishii DSM 21758]